MLVVITKDPDTVPTDDLEKADLVLEVVDEEFGHRLFTVWKSRIWTKGRRILQKDLGGYIAASQPTKRTRR